VVAVGGNRFDEARLPERRATSGCTSFGEAVAGEQMAYVADTPTRTDRLTVEVGVARALV
jgi:hypothetical protein